ncbi:hypothetical protein GGP41_002085 [Bipolaris sorokiniana]|uniref:Uncharacterized protein n=2 Tax=Cochliobolus sativus TaxID=45130 RepID=A0A8H5ZQV8_COCSA|nr:uncharacterized protein COCSADRAFT_38332 [Bipolaris sorokiniana ND90Pr]EMD62385.1 hypothetical protein COCSADRAFT_38332 [Bipolaris sorokiniana ND90Pr]KAF5853540.1 hypothetical protein GGP41_002085 [Bipolaris sorokiniana]
MHQRYTTPCPPAVKCPALAFDKKVSHHATPLMPSEQPAPVPSPPCPVPVSTYTRRGTLLVANTVASVPFYLCIYPSLVRTKRGGMPHQSVPQTPHPSSGAQHSLTLL